MAKQSNVGTLKQAMEIFAEENSDTLAHGVFDDEVEALFPEYELLKKGEPDTLERDQTWIDSVMSKIHKSPYSRIRTRQADARIADLKAKGYQKKGNYKEDMAKIKLLSRTTDPQTVYIKDQMHRDDVVDITDFDVVAYQWKMMRHVLNEELAMAALVGDGREDGDPDKIHEDHIRSIWHDDELYCIHQDVDFEAAKTKLQGTNTGANFSENYIKAEAMIEAALYSREKFKGTGTPDLYCTPHLLNVMLLARDLTDSVKATGTSTFVQAVDTLAETNISGFVSAFKGSSSKVKNVGSTLTSALASGVKSKSNTLSTTASNMAESMKNSIASKDKEFQKVGVALISALAIGIQAQVNQAVNAANYVGASAANGSGQAYTSFYMNGINLGRGLVLGMNAMQQSAYNSGYALGQAAVRGEKDGQKSHSPSKLTIQAGKWLGEGLIIGMNAMESKTYGAGKSMGETAFDSIRSALSGMNDIIDSDMDTTPTIRPVLDLTNVKATAGKLNGLFTDPAFTPLANLRAIGNISARNNQNGNSDEVVRAINRLGKSLNNVGNTYNSINSVTYDNGSEISNAVETLVRAATVGRRR